jgi:HD-like signal output (HDOD) protein
MTTSLNQLFDKIHQIPQMPEVVRDIINQLNNANVDMLKVVKNVEKEPMLTLKILRLVNSAHFGLSRKVNSIDEATLMIGLEQLKTLVIASGLMSAMPNIPNFDIKQFWNNAFLTASYAKWFAEKAELQTEVAYTIGLLANLGSLLIHLVAPKECNEIDQHVKAGKYRPDFERSRLGYTHQEACAELCRRWKLGTELITAIEQSAEPLVADTPNKFACCIFLAAYLCDSQQHGKSEDETLEGFPLQISTLIGLNKDNIEENLPNILSMNSNLEALTD